MVIRKWFDREDGRFYSRLSFRNNNQTLHQRLALTAENRIYYPRVYYNKNRFQSILDKVRQEKKNSSRRECFVHCQLGAIADINYDIRTPTIKRLLTKKKK